MSDKGQFLDFDQFERGENLKNRENIENDSRVKYQKWVSRTFKF